MQGLLPRDTYNKDASSLAISMLSPLQKLTASYEEKIGMLADADLINQEQVTDILLCRTSVQLELNQRANINPNDLKSIVRLDQRLKQSAPTINAAVALENIRLSFKPEKEWWWWFLDDYLTEQTDEISAYEQAIKQISGKDTNAFLATLVEAFITRDCIQCSLESGRLNTSHVTRLADLDDTLNKVMRGAYDLQSCEDRKRIAYSLEKARTTLKPKRSAWWWFPYLRISWLDYFDPVWTVLTLVWLAGTFGLLTDIATRFVGNGGPGTFGSIAIVFQSFLALLGGGTLTRKGQATVDTILSNLNMPKRFRQRFVFVGATGLLLLFLGFRASLPTIAIKYNNSATDDYSLGNLVAAEEKFKKAIELNPDYEIAHYNLGVIYEELGKYQDAKVQYNLAIAGSYISAYNNKARLLIIEGDHETAINLLNKGIGLAKANDTDDEITNDTNPIIEQDLWKNLGWAELSKGYLDDAETSLKLAIAIAENNEDQTREAAPYCLLAQTLDARGEQEQARTSWRSCLENARDPDNPEEGEWQKQAEKNLEL
ncbi:MAG: tetratricopeptide repeat protein [Phormidesmis sp.]